jgi:DNA-binding beta-propeller fold protein YncE
MKKSKRLHDLLIALRVVVLAAVAALLGATAHAGYTSIANTPGASNIGVAADPSGNAVYFVEWSSGKLMRVNLTPTCTAATSPACSVEEILAGFSHPQDVALDAAHNTAYVTTRDDAGTTGALWRVDLVARTRALVTFNLDAPHQIALDVATDTAYVVGYGSAANTGRLWRIQLSAGSKTALVSKLGHPVGLAVTADRTRAYVTEQDSGSLTAIDIATRSRLTPAIVTGLVQPFFLAWADPGQDALFVVERGASNDVVRVDLPTSTKNALSGLGTIPPGASGVAVNIYMNAAYITTNDSVGKVDLGSLPPTTLAFLGVGHVPSSMIGSDGYATTDPGYWIHFKDAPFGGTLNIFGNLNDFKKRGASQYRVKVTYGSTTTALTQSWTMARFNPATGKFEAATVSPISGTDRYQIPPEYPTNPERWYPTFLMMRWPSGENGLYTFTVEILDAAGALIAPQPPGNTMTVKVDNTPPDVDLLAIYQSGVTAPIDACDIVTSGSHDFQVAVKAYDANGHMLSYYADVYFGHNGYSGVGSTDSYEAGHVNADGPRLWHGVTNARRPSATTFWTAQCDCAHTFFVHAWKRTIDGYNYVIYKYAHQSITIKNTGIGCPK